MRHNNKINHLGRKTAHRKAMLSNMATSLILHKRIKTTLAKAKELRVFIEPIITKSKEDTTHSRRLAFGYLQDKNAVSELFREVSPKVMDRPGGYTRILKIGSRLGDAAEMCYIELVDFNETMLEAKTAAESKTTRRGRRGSRRKTEGAAAQEAVAAKEPAPAPEEPDAQVADVKEEQPEVKAPENEEIKTDATEETTDSQETDEQETKKTSTEAEATEKEQTTNKTNTESEDQDQSEDKEDNAKQE